MNPEQIQIFFPSWVLIETSFANQTSQFTSSYQWMFKLVAIFLAFYLRHILKLVGFPNDTLQKLNYARIQRTQV